MELRIDDRVLAVLLGLAFSGLNAFVYMYLALKLGMTTGLDILLLFVAFFVFAALRTARPRAFLYLMAVMAMSTAAVLAYTDSLGAILISGEQLPVPGTILAALISLSLLIGLLSSVYFTGYFMQGGFPWPGPRVSISIIGLLSEPKGREFRVSATRMGLAAALGGAVAGLRGLRLIPETIGSTVAGLSLSPFLAGIGLLVGFRGCLQMAAGAVGSLLVLIFLEGGSADYFSHMRSPWIFSTAVAMLVAGAGFSLYSTLKPLLASLGQKPGGRSLGTEPAPGPFSRPFILASGLLLLLVTVLAAALLQAFAGVPLPIFALCIPLALLLMVVETRGRAELAMSVGIAAFVTIIVAGLAFHDTGSLLLFQGFVLATTLGFASTLSLHKVAAHFGIGARGLRFMLAIGAVTGGLICLPCLTLLNSLYGIGTDALPAPYSVMWLEMARSAVTKVLSPSLDLFFAVVGTAIALVLHRCKLSAVSVALGLLLPVSATAAIFLGGAAAWIAEKRGFLENDHGITASGLVAGDVLVGLLFAVKALL